MDQEYSNIKKEVPVNGISVGDLIEALKEMPENATISTENDENIESVLLIWDMGEWVILKETKS
mgnify:CR=1 FL=1